jgi:DUF4097 and DUF4098 domain-containing protein YvlB
MSDKCLRLTPLVVLTAFVCLTVGCGLSIPFVAPLHEETRTSGTPHVARSAIEVVTANGSVVVKQDERDDVQVVAHLRAVSPERLEAATVVAVRDTDGALSISVDWPEGKRRNREGCNFEVLIPDADGVTLRTSNGKIELVGLDGVSDLQTSNGAITVESHSGLLKARTSNGSITARGSAGVIDASTSNGRIKIADATDRVDAKTSNGAINVSLATDGPGPIVARTSNGAITLALSPAMEGQLTLNTSNGSLNVESSLESTVVTKKKKHAVLEFGESEGRSSATTSNGSIRVKGG